MICRMLGRMKKPCIMRFAFLAVHCTREYIDCGQHKSGNRISASLVVLRLEVASAEIARWVLLAPPGPLLEWFSDSILAAQQRTADCMTQFGVMSRQISKRNLVWQPPA